MTLMFPLHLNKNFKVLKCALAKRGQKVCLKFVHAQLRIHEDTLKVLAVGRQSMAMQLNEKLKGITPLPE